MTRKCKFSALIFLFLLSGRLFAAQTDWVIGAQKFSFTKDQADSVSEGIAVMFPSRILEKLSANLYRTIQENEKAERELYKLKQDRNSLFLQLSSEIKKRDSLVLGKYSQSELNRKLEDENKKLNEIKSKLSANSERQKELLELLYQIQDDSLSENIIDKNAAQNNSFLATLFSTDQKNEYENEKIVLYNKDISALFKPSKEAVAQGIKSKQFEKEIMNAKINCLITGTITSYDEYLSVTVESYVFPGCRLINSVTEFGSIDDADLIASNIARQLAPSITNSMPVKIKINVLTEFPKNALNTYIDDILYKITDEVFTIDSGVHFIQFTADGYKNAGTNYYFEGNKTYEIKVELEKLESKIVFVVPKAAVAGDFVANGKGAQPLEDGVSKIIINGDTVLGEFITQDKNSSFFYIPQNNLSSGLLYTINVKPVDSSDYIESRRRKMYFSYSILVTSLIPTIAANGKFNSYKKMLNNASLVSGLQSSNSYNKVAQDAQIWNISSKVFSGISIACGIWFIYELYRYFDAANSVLPVNSKMTFDYKEAPPLIIETNTENTETTETEQPQTENQN